MKTECLCMGVCSTNCYIVSGEKADAVVIDPCDNGSKIYEFVRSQGKIVSKVFITHAHFDHIAGLTELYNMAKNDGDVKVYVHQDDATGLFDERLNLSATMFGTPFAFDGDVIKVKVGDKIKVGNIEFEVLSTPGHTEGSCCYMNKTERVLFSGDTLFMDSCGRTDLPGGDTGKLIRSLKKLAELDGDYKVYSGHGPYTTLEQERINNPYMP